MGPLPTTVDHPLNDHHISGDDGDHDAHSHRSRLREEMLGIRRYLFEKLHLTSFGRDDETDARHLPKVLDTVDFAGVMKHWSEGKFKKIITMVGAGISTCECILQGFMIYNPLYSGSQFHINKFY